MLYQSLMSNPSLQRVRFFLQTRFRCKVVPPSRHSLAFRAHRHRLSAFARKKNVRSRAQGNVASSEKSRFFRHDSKRSCFWYQGTTHPRRVGGGGGVSAANVACIVACGPPSPPPFGGGRGGRRQWKRAFDDESYRFGMSLAPHLNARPERARGTWGRFGP